MIEKILPSFGVLIIFACLVAYHYIRDLRGELLSTRLERDNYRRAYINVDQALRDLKGVPTPAGYYGEEHPPRETEKPVDGFRPQGIGPTVIRDREMRRERTETESRAPRFASKEVLTRRQPTPEEIAAAARKAASDGEHLN